MARPKRRLGNLPAEATSFVGRRRELAEIRKKMATARVVSLVGPGGGGKTRLAIRAASDLGRAVIGGAWLVELADVRDPALVPNAVLAALDLRDQAATEPLALLLAYLRDRQALLVVDNCEHLLAAAAELVSAVVRGTGGVRVLVTSREPLSVDGEHVVPVPPLELPAHGAQSLNQLRQNEAVALFVERAAAASGAFELATANRAAVADLCRRLDGLPLALELAAVRTRVLSVDQILERLNDRFHILTGGSRPALPRHRTLQTAIDWSHDLLSEPERVLFRRLCVFAGRFTLEDVAAVCVPDGKALDEMSSLVDKSLVIKEDARGLACYRLHETMREYAWGKLHEAGEVEAVEERCTAYYVSRCLASMPEARFRLLEWLPWMDLEIDNVRSVLRRCLAKSDSVRGLDLGTSLSWYWITRGTTEGVRWLDELLASGRGNPQTLAWTYFLRGFLAVLQADWAAAVPVLERGVELARQEGLSIQLANSLAMSSIAMNMAGDNESARRLLDDASSVANTVEDIPTKVSVLQATTLDGLFRGDVAAIVTASTEGMRLSRQVGDLYATHMMLLNLGGAALFSGDMATSKARYEESLRIAYQIDDRIGQFYLLGALATHAAVEGQMRVAAQLLGASDAIRTGAGASIIPAMMPFFAQAEDMATKALGLPRFGVEFAAGQRLTRDASIRLAVGEPVAIGGDTTGASEAGLLAQRESVVARLVAEGLSNKQIGARLFISERTVDSHVRSILNKLGFNSRAQIAAWIAAPVDVPGRRG